MPAQRVSELGLLDKFGERCGERLRIAAAADETVMAMGDDILQTADIGDNQGDSRRHRFEGDNPERFLPD